MKFRLVIDVLQEAGYLSIFCVAHSAICTVNHVFDSRQQMM